tara:strand:+ start:4694 stop:6814 length:2121 start_codon:yes stop_codon:yes gene_type:complete
MKLHTNTNTITKSENFVESNYSIDATAKAFAILSDGLYSNKILAVVRELSTNAYDSHVAAGCPERPFDVHLPTSLDNEFSIRDYGTGLSKEDCMSLYTTYFRSDKTDSNDAVGCLGLGSKSPFAYTDQFMVESFHNGNHMTFSAYKNENDEPVFALLSEQPTSDPNGLRVSFATEAGDTINFKYEAQNVWKYFVITPNTNIDVEVVSQGDATMSGDDWKICNKANRGYAKNELVMGQIGYELDADQFEGDVYDLLWRGYGLIIHANIGDVDITPSRESLSYNSRTKEFVHNKIKSILEEISTQTQQYIDDSPTLWDARLAWTGVNKNMSGVKTIREAIGEITHYKNQELFSAESWCGVELPESTKAGNNVVWYTKSKYRSTVQRQEISILKVFSRADMTIIYENEKKGSVGRVKHHLKEVKQEGNIFLIRGDEDYLEEVLTALGANRDHVADVTTLAKPPANQSSSRSSGGGYKRCEVFRCKDSGDWYSDPSTVSVKEENVFFIESSRDDYFVNGKTLQLYKFRQLLNSLTAIGADMDVLAGRLYVFTPSTVKSMKLRERSNWTDASELLTTEMRYQLELNKDRITEYESSDKNNWSSGNKGYKIAVSELQKISEECETHGELGEFIQKARPDGTDEIKDLISSAKKIGIYSTFFEKLEPVVLDIDDMYDTIIEYYPMLKIAGRWIEEDDIKMVAEYIDSINRGEK